MARGLDKGAGGGAATFTILLACMGGGAIGAVLLLPKVRKLVTRDTLVWYGALLQAVTTLTVA
jgi:hypothetical protein